MRTQLFRITTKSGLNTLQLIGLIEEGEGYGSVHKLEELRL